MSCMNGQARPKQRFATEGAARRHVRRHWAARRKELPVPYRCPGCGWVHLAHGGVELDR